MEKTTNQAYYGNRPLADALAKYDADFAFVDGLFEHASVGTFHDWLGLRWRNPARSYKPDFVKREFAVTAHEPKPFALFLRTHAPSYNVTYNGRSFPVYLADETPVSTMALWDALHDGNGDAVDEMARQIDETIAYYVSDDETLHDVVVAMTGGGR